MIASLCTAAAPEKKSETPPTQAVVRGALKSKIQLDAVFEAAAMEPVKLEPKAWADLTVLECVPHGARVKKGGLLVKLDTDKLKDQIADLEQDQPAAKVALEVASAELDNLVQTTPLRLEAAKRTQRVADEDYAYFQKTSRTQKEKDARFGVKSAEQWLENAQDELTQLEKMYKADDLTEETEGIILKRQRFGVESAQRQLDNARLNSERSLKTTIPREHETLQSQKRDQDLALSLAEQTLPKTLAKKRLEVEKMKRDQKKAEKRLADLRQDLDNLTVCAPIDGIVYYGACEGGKWTTGPVVGKKLAPGGKLAPFEVFMTVVNPEKLRLKAVAPETELSRLKPGLEGKATPVSAPDQKLVVKLEEIGIVPLPASGFEATLSLKKNGGARFMPGMNCKVAFEDVPRAEALLAPKEAVFTEGDQKVVYVLKSDGASEKRTVKTGESDARKTEITEGVSEGEKVLLKKPE